MVLAGGLLALGGGSVAGQSQDPITYNEHIRPILLDRCLTCHQPGGSAPFSLLTYQDAVSRAHRIHRAVLNRFMPPWLPDSGYGRFQGERRLSGREIQLIARWISEGLEEGPAAGSNVAPSRPGQWQLGEPDLVVTVPPFELPPHQTDVYRNLVTAVPVRETVYIRSVELIPGGTNVVHHARMMIDSTESSRQFDAAEPGPGFDGMDLVSAATNPAGFFVGWTPGKVPHEYADDLAWQMNPGTDLVLQIHLPPSETTQVVAPQIGLRFSTTVPTRQPALVMLGSFDIDIPPGDSAYTVTDSYELPVDVSVLSIYPHAHYLGKRIEGFARLPDGSVVWLLRISDWDFNWQDEYRYVRPIALPAGSTLHMRITYDNSDANPRNPHQPPRRVAYGSNSTDEMADLVIQVLPKRSSDLATLERDLNLWQYASVVTGVARQEHRQGLEQAAQGNYDVAISHFREALSNKFDEPEIHNDLGTALTLTGQIEQAGPHYREASRLAPGWAEPLANLVRVLLADPANDTAVVESLNHARRAAALTDRSDPVVLELLSRSLHANGRQPEALEVATEAMRIADTRGLETLSQRIRTRIATWREAR